MDRLQELREQWKQSEKFERSWVSDTNAEQRVNQLIEMYRLFKPHIEETEALFGPERRQAQANLQARIAKLRR